MSQLWLGILIGLVVGALAPVGLAKLKSLIG
jgi:hypothetical protein